MSYKVSALKSVGACSSNDVNSLVETTVCDLKSKNCMYNECADCKNKKPTFISTDSEEVRWTEWVRKEEEYEKKNCISFPTKRTLKKMAKEKQTSTVSILEKKLCEGMVRFKRHIYNIQQQYHAYRTCLDNLQPNEAALHIDFSKNYSCKLAEEVQGHHFGASRNQITLHTGVLYIGCSEPENKLNPISFCSISSCNEHGPSAIWAHLSPIVNVIKTDFKEVSTVHFFPMDRVPSTDRSKIFIFSVIKYLNMDLVWELGPTLSQVMAKERLTGSEGL